MSDGKSKVGDLFPIKLQRPNMMWVLALQNAIFATNIENNPEPTASGDIQAHSLNCDFNREGFCWLRKRWARMPGGRQISPCLSATILDLCHWTTSSSS